MNRLAMLRDEMDITQGAMAQRTGLSLPYIKKLEQGTKPMSKRPAMAIALATGVDLRWLTGLGKPRPIMARLGLSKAEIKTAFKSNPSAATRKLMTEGVRWTKGMADKIHSRWSAPNDEENPNWNKAAAERESQVCQHYHLIVSDQLAQIILEAFKSNRASLALARIGDSVKGIGKEFNVKLAGFRRNSNVTKRLADDLKREIARRFAKR